MLASVAATRQIPPAQLSRLVKGDLDWIVMKALEKDRSRRYETANGLARDVQRYLDDEVVEACPPSVSYRVQKFVRRNKGQVIAGSLVALALVAGMLGTGWGMMRAEERRVEADKSRVIANEEKEKAQKLAESEQSARKQAQSVLKFFQDRVFSAAQPEGTPGGLGKQVTLRQAIDAAEPTLKSTFESDPVVEASIRNALGTTYFYLGERAIAAEQYRKAIDLRMKELGPRHPDTLQSRYDFGTSIVDFPGRLLEAIEIQEDTLKLRREVLGEEHLDTLYSTQELAQRYYETGTRLDEASSLVDHAIPIARRVHGDRNQCTLMLTTTASLLLYREGKRAEAIELLESVVSVDAELGSLSNIQMSLLSHLSIFYSSIDKQEQSLKINQRVADETVNRLGLLHRSSIGVRRNLSYSYYKSGNSARALELSKQLLNDIEVKFGTDSPQAQEQRYSLGSLLRDEVDKSDLVFEYMKPHIDKMLATVPRTQFISGSLYDSAIVMLKIGRVDVAVSLFNESIAFDKTQFEELDPQRCVKLLDAADELLKFKHPKEAEPLLRESLKIRSLKLPDSWGKFNVESMLGQSLSMQKRYDEANRYSCRVTRA